LRQILSLAALSLLLAGACSFAQAAYPVSLSGTWRFELDRADAGIQERWFERTLSQKIQLPGALQNQGFGDDVTVDTKWTGEVGTDRWKQRPEYAKYRQPGNIKVPFFLQPEKHYVGAAWYQRDIEIPKDWQGKRVVLTLERPHWGTHVWLDSRLIGTNLSLSTPHVYDLGTSLSSGKHTLTLRVDNRVLVEVGDWSHSVSDHTQGNWNGVVGRMELSATPAVWIEDVEVHPNTARKSARLKARIGNATGQPGTGKLAVGEATMPVSWDASGGNAEIEVPLGANAGFWDEFIPSLHRLAVTLVTDHGSRFTFHVTFGLREITTQARQFMLNGRPTFFRGTLECCIFPKTGYPPTDVDSWKRIVRVCKEHGLNHIRFHSWCPPEAAFVAADELGFYYQVECGVWTQPGNGKAIDQWLYDESERIVRAYGNHPSFVLLTHGNEPHGPNHQKYLAGWVSFWKQRDPRRLYTSGSAYPQLPENQYHVFYPCRGPHGWLGRDYRKDVEKLEVPVIVHEMGQWCVYPNFDEVKKYTGPLKPKNFEIFRDSLTEHGMLDQLKDFLHASGKLQALCYKEECEAAMRTPGIGGVQLLDLHDFPGQGTALVGVLDPFWESKGYIKPAEFRRFYNSTVPLARLLKRTWTTDETLTADVEVSHYGPAPLENASADWKLVDEKGQAVTHGEFPARTLPVDRGLALGRVEIPLARLTAPAAYKLVVSVMGTTRGSRVEPGGSPGSPSGSSRRAAENHPPAAGAPPQSFENDWNIWVYPASSPAAPPGDVLVTAKLDESALARLQAGGRVLLAGMKLSPVHPRLGFEPIFWNRYMFNTQGRQTLGLLVQPKHPALAQFPTESWQDWQWNDIVSQARGVILDELPRGLLPIVQPIDDWNSNRQLGLIWECRVASGRLLVCAADLDTKLDERPATRQLRASLLAYAASDRFKPKVAVSQEDLTRVLHRASKSTMVNLGAKVLKVDSEDRENGNTADKAIDGDPDTIWHTRWQPRNDPMPHSLVMDLGREVTLRGIRYLPRQDQVNGRIAEAEIFCATDPESWGAPVATAQWRNSEQLQTVQFAQPLKARYLKLVVKSEINRNPFASVAELDVVTDGK
jgi:hypothetical protein